MSATTAFPARGSSRRRARRAGVALALVLAAGLVPAAVPLRAQAFDGTAAGYSLQRRLAYRGGVYDQTGMVYGGAASVQVARVRLSAAGWTGSLAAAGGPPNGDAKLRTTAVSLHAVITSTLLLGYRVEARRFESDAGVTVWKLRGWDILLEPDLGIPGLRGLADVAVLSSSSVREGPAMDVALQTTMGVTFTPARSRVRVRLAYRFERYDIQGPTPATQRLEQFRGLIVEAGMHLGR